MSRSPWLLPPTATDALLVEHIPARSANDTGPSTPSAVSPDEQACELVQVADGRRFGARPAAQDYAILLNDLFSYQKEIEYEGEMHNMVQVVETFLNVDRHRAAALVAELMKARMEEFELLVEHDLPAMFDELDLDATARAVLVDRVAGLKDWVSGVLEWHRRCPRYTEAELQRSRVPTTPSGLPLAPVGLGTSAARVFAGSGR